MNRQLDGHKRRRALLAKLLRMEEDTHQFDFVWECLVEDEIVEDWERGATSTEDVRLDAQRLRHRYRRARGEHFSSDGQKRERRTVQYVPVEPTERERAATEAFRKYLAAHAAGRPLVQRFRRDYLPHGRLLTEDEQISSLLVEQLVAEVDVKQYLDSHRGKPARMVRFKLSTEPPTDDSWIIPFEDVAEILAEEERDQVRQMEEEWWGQREWERTVRWDDSPTETPTEEETAEERRRQQKWEGYFGWHLEALGEWLADKYPWENVGDAVVFLVSGRPPRLAEPLSAAINEGNATFSITFSPWVSEETVLRAYRAFQSFHRQPPGGKTLRVLHFVSEQTDEEGHFPSWDEMCHRWNVAYPNEAFKHRSALRRAYLRAVEALVPPYLPLGPGW